MLVFGAAEQNPVVGLIAASPETPYQVRKSDAMGAL